MRQPATTLAARDAGNRRRVDQIGSVEARTYLTAVSEQTWCILFYCRGGTAALQYIFHIRPAAVSCSVQSSWMGRMRHSLPTLPRRTRRHDRITLLLPGCTGGTVDRGDQFP